MACSGCEGEKLNTIEQTLSEMMARPLVFGALFLLAVISSVPILFKFVTASFRVGKSLATQGLGAAANLVVNSVKEQSISISDSLFPNALIAKRIMRVIFYLAQVIFWGILTLAILQVSSDKILIDIASVVTGGSAEFEYSTWPVILFIALFFLYFLIFCGYITLQMSVMQILGSIKREQIRKASV